MKSIRNIFILTCMTIILMFCLSDTKAQATVINSKSCQYQGGTLKLYSDPSSSSYTSTPITAIRSVKVGAAMGPDGNVYTGVSDTVNYVVSSFPIPLLTLYPTHLYTHSSPNPNYFPNPVHEDGACTNNHTVSFTCEIRPTLFTLTFDLKGGTGGPTSSISAWAGKSITMPSNVPTKSGYQFNGWLLNNDVYQPGQSFTYNNNSYVYKFVAQWSQVVTANYSIEHYKQKADGSGYEKEAGMTGSGNATVGTGVDAWTSATERGDLK